MNVEHTILHQKFVRYGSNAKEWIRKCDLLLPEIERQRIWEHKGFGSLYEYAAKLAGMSRDHVNDVLRVLRKIEDKPSLQKVVEEKGISAVRPVVGIATAETADFWAEKANIMSKNTLETYVKEIRTQEENGRPGTAGIAGFPYHKAIENSKSPGNQTAIFNSTVEGNPPPPKPPTSVTLTMDIEPEVASQLQKLRQNSDWNQLMKELLSIREQQLEEQKPEPVKTESRHIPAKIKRHVMARTKGICSFPNCKKPYKILHHTQRFALEKVHDPDRLEPLCQAHERLAHLGLVSNEELRAARWQVRLLPDENAEKHKVDTLVAKYRSPGVILWH